MGRACGNDDDVARFELMSYTALDSRAARAGTVFFRDLHATSLPGLRIDQRAARHERRRALEHVINFRHFVVQGGGFTPGLTEKPAGPAIVNEANNGLSNADGTIAMAREAAPDSARSEFYFNVANNSRLDYKAPTPSGAGYAVFGKVTHGMDVVRRISRVDTGTVGEMADVPLTPVILTRAVILKR